MKTSIEMSILQLERRSRHRHMSNHVENKLYARSERLFSEVTFVRRTQRSVKMQICQRMLSTILQQLRGMTSTDHFCNGQFECSDTTTVTVGIRAIF